MTQHTPGPWKVENSNGNNRGSLYTGTEVKPDWFMNISEYHHNLARDKRAREEYEANARLIAAAPELLEALEKLSELMSMSDAAFTSVNVNAKKAIKKARFG